MKVKCIKAHTMNDNYVSKNTEAEVHIFPEGYGDYAYLIEMNNSYTGTPDISVGYKNEEIFNKYWNKI